MLSQLVIRKYPYRDGWAGGAGTAGPGEPARPFCSRQILQVQRRASSANVRDKTDTAMHFHTFIRPGVRKIVDQNMNLYPAGSPAWKIIRLGARRNVT